MIKGSQETARVEVLRDMSQSRADSARGERFRARVSLIGGSVLGLAFNALGAYMLTKGHAADGIYASALGTTIIAGADTVGVREYMEAAVLQQQADSYEDRYLKQAEAIE